MNIKGSKTEENLLKAFYAETKARTMYTYYAAKAREEGYTQIANIFEETAGNEHEHSDIWYGLLYGERPSTMDNLLEAALGENHEWTEMYKEFAEEAREEGYDKIADLFEEVGKIEKDHEERYRDLYENMKSDSVFERDEKVKWHCQNCGHVHVGKKAPNKCPVCGHPQSDFQIKAENY